MSVLYIIVLILAVAASITLAAYTIHDIVTAKKNGKKSTVFTEKTARVLKSLAEQNSWALLSDLDIPMMTGSQKLHVDFLLIADKYIYLVQPVFMEGALSGKDTGLLWTHWNTEGVSSSVRNYFQNGAFSASYVEKNLTGYSSDELNLIVPIITLPNSLSVDPELSKQKDGKYLFRLKYLSRGIANIEKTADISPITNETKEAVKRRFLAAKSA